jgi:hypothetical protein
MYSDVCNKYTAFLRSVTCSPFSSSPPACSHSSETAEESAFSNDRTLLDTSIHDSLLAAVYPDFDRFSTQNMLNQPSKHASDIAGFDPELKVIGARAIVGSRFHLLHSSQLFSPFTASLGCPGSLATIEKENAPVFSRQLSADCDSQPLETLKYPNSSRDSVVPLSISTVPVPFRLLPAVSRNTGWRAVHKIVEELPTTSSQKHRQKRKGPPELLIQLDRKQKKTRLEPAVESLHHPARLYDTIHLSNSPPRTGCAPTLLSHAATLALLSLDSRASVDVAQVLDGLVDISLKDLVLFSKDATVSGRRFVVFGEKPRGRKGGQC